MNCGLVRGGSLKKRKNRIDHYVQYVHECVIHTVHTLLSLKYWLSRILATWQLSANSVFGLALKSVRLKSLCS